jgi:hypothetical protein
LPFAILAFDVSDFDKKKHGANQSSFAVLHICSEKKKNRTLVAM